jgi:hypothetical protein
MDLICFLENELEKAIAKLTEKQKSIYKDWLKDGCFDLPENKKFERVTYLQFLLDEASKMQEAYEFHEAFKYHIEKLKGLIK